MPLAFPKPTKSALTIALLLAVAVAVPACGDGEDAGDSIRHFSWRRVRILVADAQTGQLSLFDAEDAAITHRFELGQPADLHASFTGAHGLAATPSGVRLVSSGVSIIDHANHIHIYKRAPQLLDGTIGTQSLTHVTANGAFVLLAFGDPDGSHTLIDEAQPLETGVVGTTGVAPLLLPDGLLRLIPDAEQASFHPFETDAHATELPLPGCPTIVRTATAGNQVALACNTGFIVSSMPGWSPALQTDGRAASTTQILLHPSHPIAVVRLANDNVTVVTPNAITGTWILPVGVCDMALDPGTGDTLVALLGDGEVRTFAREGTPLQTVTKVAAPFVCTDASRPRLGVAPERAYVVDPRTGHLVDVDLRGRGRVAARHLVGGHPGALVVLGLDPRNAGLRGPMAGEP